VYGLVNKSAHEVLPTRTLLPADAVRCLKTGISSTLRADDLSPESPPVLAYKPVEPPDEFAIFLAVANVEGIQVSLDTPKLM